MSLLNFDDELEEWEKEGLTEEEYRYAMYEGRLTNIMLQEEEKRKGRKLTPTEVMDIIYRE